MAFSSIQDIQTLIAQSFFDGDTGIAGIVMYACVMAFIFMIFARNNLMIAFALMFPVTFIFTMLGILPETMTVLLIIVAVVGLAKERRDHMS